ncbi:MAG: hypothetical protein ACI8XO_003567 [Verrucomicrobiales bacterium]|jgi:hypothetical protein
MPPTTSPSSTRRKFIAGSAAAAASLNLVTPGTAFGADANSKIRIGFVGCGGRGSFVAGNVMIRGGKESFFRGGKSPNLYKSGSVANVKQFRETITAGKSDISTVAGSAETTLVTILGRQAGVADGALDWDNVAADKTERQPDLGGFKA